MRTFLKTVLFLAVVGIPSALFYLSKPAGVELQPVPTAIGADTTLQIVTTNPCGIRRLLVEVRQGEHSVESRQELSANRFRFWRERLPAETHKVRVRAAAEAGFRSGPAVLRVEAVSNDFRGQTTARQFNVMVSLEPPVLHVDEEWRAAAQGSVGLIRLRTGGYWTEAGVKVGDTRFRSYPLPGSRDPNRRFALFAIPWDAAPGTAISAYVRNDAGQEVESPLACRIVRQNFRRRDLKLDRSFLEKAVAGINGSIQGDLLDAFLKINRTVREENNRTLAALREQTEEKPLWSEGFAQASSTKVEAFFADVRSYIYEGRKVDQQVHLGFDLASTKQAPVEAANAGRVVFAGNLGIYGNCVVVDHGYGLQSIYGHLSSIGVKLGDRVARRQVLGRTGTTGLAGGDHLHFSMQLDGIQVSPRDWLQSSPIRQRVQDLMAQTK